MSANEYFLMHRVTIGVKRPLCSNENMTNLAVFDNVIEQLSSWYILHHHKDVRGGTDHLVPVQKQKTNLTGKKYTGDSYRENNFHFTVHKSFQEPNS